MGKRYLFYIVIICFSLVSCFTKENTNKDFLIFCSLPPQAYYIEKIVGDKADVSILLPPFASPEHFELKPKDVVKLEKASVWITLGGLFVFEKQWIQKISSMKHHPRIVDSSRGIQLKNINYNQKQTQFDPHIWLSPRLMQIQAQNFYEALILIDSKNRVYYKKNLDELLSELRNLEETIRNKLEGLKQRTFIVFHPSWSYFAYDFGLEQIAIESEGKEPGIEYLKSFIDQTRKDGLRTIFIEPQYSSKQASLIAREINASVVSIDTLSKNYREMLLEFVEKLTEHEE